MTGAAPITHPVRVVEDGAVLQYYGVVPWRLGRRGSLEVILVTSPAGESWRLPKGRPVRGRSPAQSAARRAFEQAGVIGQPQGEPLGSCRFLETREDEPEQPCAVTLFGFRVKGTLLNWPDRDRRRRSWLPLDEAADLIEQPELAQLVRSLEDDPQAFG